MTTPRIWSVSEVNKAVKKLLESSIESVLVSGEVANWTRARSGHCYFTLKDDKAQIRCAMFRLAAAALPADPEQGMNVRAFGVLSIYEARGEYQLVVQHLEAESKEGLWQLAFERVRDKLDAEGLLAIERKRLLPNFPKSVGVVTSIAGAALHDITTVMQRRAPWTRIIVRDTRVQGEGSEAEIAGAIEVLGNSGLVDVLIISRGGGSLEDLWSFNSEIVARAIVNCRVPVISAVGHEIDVTVADLVADYRAPTPSVGGEVAVQDVERLGDLLVSNTERMKRALLDDCLRKYELLVNLMDKVRNSISIITRFRKENLDRVGDRMEVATRKFVLARALHLTEVSSKMDILSPLATLSRGYALPQDHSGKILRTKSELNPGVNFSLRVSDGKVPCEVTKRE